MKPRHKIVYIEWVDSIGGQGHWHEFDPSSMDQAYSCHTVGYLVAESEDYVAITSNIAPENDLHGTTESIFGEIMIPKIAIKTRKVLRG